MQNRDGWVCLLLFINAHCLWHPIESSLCHGLNVFPPMPLLGLFLNLSTWWRGRWCFWWQCERRPPPHGQAIGQQRSPNLAAWLLLLLLVEHFRHTFWIKPSLDNWELEPAQTWASRRGITLFPELLNDSEEKHLRQSTAALHTRVLASRAARSFVRAFLSENCFCAALLASDYAQGGSKEAWWLALRMRPVLYLSLS